MIVHSSLSCSVTGVAAFWKKGIQHKSLGPGGRPCFSACQWQSNVAEGVRWGSTIWHGAKLSFSRWIVVKGESFPIQDEPEEEAGFQYKMSLERWHAED